MPDNKFKLLVADDHRLFVEGLKLVLKEEVHITIEGFALNGKDAIEKCINGDYNMVLMDINMPVIDGIEATREIKRHKPDIKILMISMLADYASVIKALKAGADGYIIKNADTSELIKALKQIQKGEIYLSESLSKIFTKDGYGKITAREEYIHFSENLISPREQQILKLIVEGFTDQQIAETLFLSDKTVSTHRKNMLAKLNLHNTAALVKFAFDNKLV
jgi:DNA-binding NarL/FixJ family response regulator